MTHPPRPLNLFHVYIHAKNNGWTVTSSSDGYATFGTGDHLTSNNTGAGGFGNPNAWCVLSKVLNSKTFQFSIQTDGYNGLRVKYSKLSFTGSTATLPSTPLAPDEAIVLGGGSDATPTFQAIVSGSMHFTTDTVKMMLETSANKLNFILDTGVVTTPTRVAPPKPSINRILK